MATCNYIKAKQQNQSALRAVIRYVSQDAKTLDEDGHRYLSGINCIGAAAYDEFMATKNLYGKRSGVYYYHYEQSFAPDKRGVGMRRRWRWEPKPAACPASAGVLLCTHRLSNSRQRRISTR